MLPVWRNTSGLAVRTQAQEQARDRNRPRPTRSARLCDMFCRCVLPVGGASGRPGQPPHPAPTTARPAARCGAPGHVPCIERAAPACRLRLVAEEDSEDLCTPAGAGMLATVTDLVNRTLQGSFPGTPALSSAAVVSLIDLGDSEAGPTGAHWVLDPIDGTRGFEAGRQYAVCLGLLQDGVGTLGVLGCPEAPLGRPVVQADADPSDDCGTARPGVGAIFVAARGAGAFTGALAADGAPRA